MKHQPDPGNTGFRFSREGDMKDVASIIAVALMLIAVLVFIYKVLELLVHG